MFTLEDTAWIRSRIFFKDFINFVSLQKAVIFAIFHQIRIKTRCTPSIYALSICGLITTLQCTRWEIQPGHEIEYFLKFYKIV